MKPWTNSIWIYDLRTNKEFTLNTRQLKREDLDEFVECYNPKNRPDRKPLWSEGNPEGRRREFTYDEVIERDKAYLDITWLKDASLGDSENLPDPNDLVADILNDLALAIEKMGQLGIDKSEPHS
ncbi:MAG: hypothetical protein KDC26_04500 [Armatimonadetes bacterium]|nr:hypothetical protein [Armatimonadota bacterium]